MKYTVFYGNTKIGVLEINDKGQHKYTPDKEGTKTVRKSISLFYELLEESDWCEPIQLFENRIADARKFGEETDIQNQTDDFILVKED